MAGVNVDYINPFLMAATHVLRDMCFIETKIGKPSVKEIQFASDTYSIMIGVTGEMKGQVLLGFPFEVACDVTSKMIMSPVTEMNELTNSALCELGNMILGNAATFFSTKGIAIDITPPMLCQGNVRLSTNSVANICIPLLYDDTKTIEIHVAIKGDN